MTEPPPWRRPRRAQFPGVPAWGAPVDRLHDEPFETCGLDSMTGELPWCGADGARVRICLLDSGVDASHPRVGGLDQAMEVATGPEGGIDVVQAEPNDKVGHGTACASVIRSVAPAALLSSVRVLTNGKYGAGKALLAGLRWAIENDFDIVNLSLSTAKTQFIDELRELSDQAYFRRCVLVTAAHNLPVRSYPWPFASVISVASHNGPDPMTYYYNPSPPVDFYARGMRVPVAWPGGRETRSTGNSFAAPHIAGICALILSKHPMLTPFQLKSVLYSAARNVARPEGGSRVSE
jgi:subtilisin family serine protease